MRLQAVRLGTFATIVLAGLLTSAMQPSIGSAAPTSQSEHTCNPMSPSRVETGQLGETIYHFRVGDVDQLQIVPPKNFDFLSASPDELQELGIPQRPSDPELAEAWIARMSRASAAPPGLCAPDEGLPGARADFIDEKFIGSDLQQYGPSVGACLGYGDRPGRCCRESSALRASAAVGPEGLPAPATTGWRSGSPGR